MSQSIPLPGMSVYLRGRWGQITSVEPFHTQTAEGVLNLVGVEYLGGDGGGSDQVIWEREADARLQEPGKLKDLVGGQPLAPPAYHALVRASRWSALTPYLDPTDTTQRSGEIVSAPYFGSLQIEDFQLTPLLRALKMPRISLLVADDVGLGKTLEAGMVIQELLLRRKIRRVLILTPASLKSQWIGEMKDRFSLKFDMVDRDETAKLRRDQGLSANPWRLLPRIITSYHYLRQPDVLEQFLSTCRPKEGETLSRLPWDLLIVDEAHNLMPSSYGNDSDLVKMLRQLSTYFEHKLFLTATPHNGHTRSFTGLLELLDPVRFTQKSEMEPSDRERAGAVVVRRLKREINALDQSKGMVPRFVSRKIDPQHVYFSGPEAELSRVFTAFHSAFKAILAAQPRGRRQAGAFAVEVLLKRLLSCPYAFANSWFRLLEGFETQGFTVTDDDVSRQNELALKDDTEDDGEKEGRALAANRTLGTWLQPFKSQLNGQITSVTEAIRAMGFDAAGTIPRSLDGRTEKLVQLIDEELRDSENWVADERLIVFTEYKTTLDYLFSTMGRLWPDAAERVLMLYGGMDESQREAIKARFNDPADPVRILLATDSASEGLNLQQTARRLMHFDIPWNPSRLEQRNGRLDRHGQARDVIVSHFTSDDNLDLQFLGKVLVKVHTVREDLGTMGEVFDRAFQRRLLDRDQTKDWEASLDRSLDDRKKKIEEYRTASPVLAEVEALSSVKAALGVEPQALLQTVEVGIGLDTNWHLKEVEPGLRWELGQPIPPGWIGIVDDELRVGSSKTIRGTLPSLAFDSKVYMTTVGSRSVFRPRKDTILLHLGHAFVREVLFHWNQRRYSPSFSGRIWSFGEAPLEPGVLAEFHVTVEEVGVNDLRETFHHWVRTISFPLTSQGLGPSRVVPATFRVAENKERFSAAQTYLEDFQDQLRQKIVDMSADITNQARRLLGEDRVTALREETEKFDSRIGEVSRARRETTLERLKKERDALEAEIRQGYLFDEVLEEDLLKLRSLEEELQARVTHYEDLENFLKRERERMLKQVLPYRFQMSHAVQVFPVGVEVILPEARRG